MTLNSTRGHRGSKPTSSWVIFLLLVSDHPTNNQWMDILLPTGSAGSLCFAEEKLQRPKSSTMGRGGGVT